MRKTKIIAIEGIDGSGKGTQLKKLQETLTQMGLSVATRDYPRYDSFFGAQVGKLLSASEDVSASDVDGKSMALWYALDRFEDFRGYEDGGSDILLINRFVLSNAVYQSIRDIDLDKPDIVEWVFELEYGHFKLPVPDVILFFDVERESAEKNVDKKGHRDYVGDGRDVYEASSGIQQRARLKYLECAKRYDNIAVIPCTINGEMRSVEDIASSALAELRVRGII